MADTPTKDDDHDHQPARRPEREPLRPDLAEPRQMVRVLPNPLGHAERPQGSIGALANAEQQRAVAEIQARMMIARANPRDAIRCMDLILQDCTRPTLAETALYQYSRGGSAISGPSIRLAEAMARRWGNIASGIKEISRQDGNSECVAYAWDLETGYYDERQFQIRHWRDTKRGGHAITDERDIYELIANLGQRRKRAVLLTVLPGDVVEAATAQCEETLKASTDGSPEAIKKMIEAFGAIGVNRAQIETRCQCRAESIRPAQLIQLRKIYTSIRDEMSRPEDWFDPVQLADAPQRQQAKPEVSDRHSPEQAASQSQAAQVAQSQVDKAKPTTKTAESDRAVSSAADASVMMQSDTVPAENKDVKDNADAKKTDGKETGKRKRVQFQV